MKGLKKKSMHMKKSALKGPEKTRIFIENEQDNIVFDERLVKLIENTVLTCLKNENINVGCLVDIYISDDASIRKINRQFRNIDSATDVLSFPIVNMKDGIVLSSDGDYDPEEGLLLLGDIIISLETAQKQAEQYEHTLDRELSFLVSHGVFHLLGYDHILKDEEAVMLEKQEEALEKLGLKRI